MNSKNEVKLCPNCRTGADSYKLDGRSPFCPYLKLHTGQACAKYEPMDNIEVEGGRHEKQGSR